MTNSEILVLLAMTAYAVWRQSIRHELNGKSRFRLAIIYAVVGLATGGFQLPPDAGAWLELGLSLLASVLIGVARGRLTRLSVDADGRVFSQGTPLTIGLFLLLVAGKFAWGTWEYFHHASAPAGFGEVLLMIAAMAAMQAEVVWRRVAGLLEAKPVQSPPARSGNSR
jgi:hypothetical protein